MSIQNVSNKNKYFFFLNECSFNNIMNHFHLHVRLTDHMWSLYYKYLLKTMLCSWNLCLFSYPSEHFWKPQLTYPTIQTNVATFQNEGAVVSLPCKCILSMNMNKPVGTLATQKCKLHWENECWKHSLGNFPPLKGKWGSAERWQNDSFSLFCRQITCCFSIWVWLLAVRFQHIMRLSVYVEWGQ